MARQKPSIGVVVFVVGTVLVAGAIGYRAFNPVEFSAEEVSREQVKLTVIEMQALAEQTPEDPALWQKLAETHFAAGGYAEAVQAYGRALAADPGNAALWSALGESRKMASTTAAMPAEALAAFEQAIALDPADPRGRYFLGLQKNLSGDPRGALDDWLALLADTPQGSVWEGNLRRAIAQVAAANDIEIAAQLTEIDQARAQAATTP